jgi:peptidoglycan/LPS O-acetylase OafA/YrhL
MRLNNLQKSVNHIPSLDGLRAISIVFVVYDHSVIITGKNILPEVLQIFISGKTGVDLFFLISGFLITTLLLNEFKQTNCIDLKRFYIRRSLRIFPAYYFLLLIYFIMQKFELLYINPQTWVSSFFYMRQFFGSGWLTSHFWSLSIEELFYMIFPLLLLFFLNRKIENLNLLLILVVFLGLPLARLYFEIVGVKVSMLSFFYRGEALIFGVLIALNRRWLSHRDYKGWPTFLIIFVFGVLSIFLELNTEGKIYKNILLLSYFLPLVKVIFFAFLFWVILNLRKGFIFTLLNSTVFVFLGLISYSIYLWQQLFLSDVFNKIQLSIFTRIFILLAISLFSFYLIETPFNKLKRKF